LIALYITFLFCYVNILKPVKVNTFKRLVSMVHVLRVIFSGREMQQVLSLNESMTSMRITLWLQSEDNEANNEKRIIY